jgi:hypothetical protein
MAMICGPKYTEMSKILEYGKMETGFGIKIGGPQGNRETAERG